MRNQTVETPGERERAEALSHFNRTRRRVRRGRAIFAAENPFPEQKSIPCSLRARKSLDFSGDWWGWQWRGSLLPRPPACQSILTS